jgi:hypothetical protein
MAQYDIYENPAQVNTVEKVRSFRTEIETPYAGDRTISFHSERLVMDASKGEAAEAVIARKPQAPVVRPFSGVMLELITFTDPVTQKSVTISVAGLATAINDRYVTWYEQDKAAAAAAAGQTLRPE